jgi:hypothetical protein
MIELFLLIVIASLFAGAAVITIERWWLSMLMATTSVLIVCSIAMAVS